MAIHVSSPHLLAVCSAAASEPHTSHLLDLRECFRFVAFDDACKSSKIQMRTPEVIPKHSVKRGGTVPIATSWLGSATGEDASPRMPSAFCV